MIGDRLNLRKGFDAFPVVRRPGVGPRDAVTKTLAAYLMRVEFGSEAPFHLETVLDEWPVTDVELVYPSASVVCMVDREIAGLTPAMVEQSWHRFGTDTVLWKTGEFSADLQVDFWTAEPQTRTAIDAALDSVFNPAEGYSGITLEGPEGFFCEPVRCTLTTRKTERGTDNEFRLRAMVRASMAVVHLRGAPRLDPTIILDESGAGLDPSGDAC